MKPTLFLLALVGFLATIAVGQDRSVAPWAERADFVSDASYLVATYQPAAIDRSAEGLAKVANAFIDSLDEPLKARSSLPIDDPERRKWTNLPPRPDAGGVRLGELNDTQLKAACDLMAAIFSDSGYRKMWEIMLGDDQLLNGGQPQPGFGTVEFSVMVFGSPSANNPWAFQLDGHHLGVNVAVQGDQISLSPSFVGAQPEQFEIADRQFRPFAGELDDAFKLISLLSDPQRIEAVTSYEPGEIRLGPGSDGNEMEPEGVCCSTFDDAQRQQLMELLDNWIDNLPPAQAESRMKQIAAELDKTFFSWNGETEPPNDMSYTIQGPSIIIEFSCQGRGNQPFDHLHSMYRDPTNEYGGQLE